MIMMYSPTWADFVQTCCVKKNLVLQFSETPTNYTVYGSDNVFIWEYILIKDGGTDVTDFESNYKAKCNYCAGVSNLPFPVDNYECAYDGIGLTEITSEVQNLYFKIPEDNLFLPGGGCVGKNIAIGDWFEMKIVDHDNLLGYGVDFVLKHWMKKRFLGVDGCECLTPYAGQPPKDFYIMITYHKGGEQGANPDPKICINFNFHKKVL